MNGDVCQSIAAHCEGRGWPEALAAVWAGRGLRHWTALQRKAVESGIFGNDAGVREDWLIAAPTSAGKGLVAEAAALEHLFCGEKVLWLVPTRALAQSLGQDLGPALESCSLRLAVSSGDHPDADRAIEEGVWDLLVAVYEKGLQWLARSPDALAGVGLAVIDELGMLRDAERGGRLDLLLTLIDNSPYAPRRIGLCPAGAEAAALARRLDWKLLLDESRPRPLREGVLDFETGAFHWLDRASGERGVEELMEARRWSEFVARTEVGLGDLFASPALLGTLAAAAWLGSLEEPTLLFVPSRSAAREWARALAEISTNACAEKKECAALRDEAERLARREPCGDHELLSQLLPRGVAYHHGDLSLEARRMVEQAFDGGAISCLVATSTLAHGLNLTAANVIQWPRAFRSSDGDSAGTRQAPIERWRWRQQAGRAARLGRGEGPGRALAVAENAEQAGRLWRHYMEGRTEPLAPAPRGTAMGIGILAALAGGASRTPENLLDLFAAREPAARRNSIAAQVSEALAECRDAKLIHGKSALRLGTLGGICALRGIEPAIIQRLTPWLHEECDPAGAEGEGMLPAIWGLALAAPAGYWPAARRGGGAAQRAREWFAMREGPVPGPLEACLAAGGFPCAREAAALEAGWRLAIWIGGEATSEVEERTGWAAGALERAGEGLAWLAGALAEAGSASGWPPARAGAWRALGIRLAAGATAEGIGLARLRVAGLGRMALRRLLHEGICGAASIAQIPETELARIVQCAATARRLKQAALESISKFEDRISNKIFPVSPPSLEHKKSSSPSAQPTKYSPPDIMPHSELRFAHSPLLALDLQSPGLARAAGIEVVLPPLGWDLLAALAESPGKVVTRQSLYHRLWPDDDSPEPQQLDAHRRRLLAKLGPALNGRTGELIGVVRGIGFRLNLCEAEVSLSR